MQYEFTYRNTPGDYLRFRLDNTYHVWTGIVNIVFTVVFVVLLFTRFGSTNLLGKILIIIGLLVFPVIQPLAMYLVARKESGKIQVETTLRFNESGMQILVQEHRQDFLWRDMYPLVKRSTMIIVTPDGMHAYLIPNRAMGDQREAFWQFSEEQIRKYSKHADEK